MSKINLDPQQRGIVKHMTPAGEYNSLYSIDENVSVFQEMRNAKVYWISETILSPKAGGFVESGEESLRYQTEFHIEKNEEGKKLLVVNPLMKCGNQGAFCQKMVPRMNEWKSRINGNFAIHSFAEEIMGEKSPNLAIVSQEEFLQLQSQKNETRGNWSPALALVAGALNLGSLLLFGHGFKETMGPKSSHKETRR